MTGRKNMLRYAVIPALLLAAAPALRAQERLDEKRTATPDGTVEIENQAGSIVVIGWPQNEITVTGTLGRGAEGLEFSGGRHTSISVDTSNPHGVRSDLEIHVPAGSKIDIDTFSASVKISGVTGAIHVESVNSSIAIDAPSREIEASSVNGSVEVSGQAQRLKLESVNGAVTARGASGEIEANTVNGQLSVVGGTFLRATLETVSGGLSFEGDLDPKARLEAQTVSGGIELVLPGTVRANFSASTFSGEIVNELGPSAHKTSKYTTEKELEFETGGGGADVSLQTLSGAIRIRKRP
jgi:DUF4097 and DUF4098 domain-containing protein YvlB